MTVTDETTSGGWRPNPGDTVKGKVVDISTTDMGYGPYAIVSLDTGGGQVDVHAFHTVLRRELARRRPAHGDELEITYVGKKSDGGMGGKGYDLYRVKSDKDVVGYDWSRDMPEGSEGATLDVPIPPAPIPPPAADEKPKGGQFGDEVPW